jgi:HD-GYP domain-containing protein (c-di-GMP phosphodiesterase class II)/ribonuclease BN (tRNA processing enzyme)
MKSVQELAAERIKLILSYINKIALELDSNKVLMLLADMGRDLTHADRCTVWVLDHESSNIWTKVAHGVNRISIPFNSGLVGYSIANDESITIDDVYNDERFNSSIDKKTGYRTRSMLVIPLHDSDGKVIGAYQVINKLTGDLVFTADDLDYIRLASTFAGNSIESSLLVEEIKETQAEVIFAMGAIGERRSKETGNHVTRVAKYSRILAELYGLSEEECEMIELVSPMHDIGKVGIPDAILNKPGSFNKSEWQIMMTHAQLGYEMLEKSQRPLLQASAIVAREHHEKWNGKGYPKGLKGDEIHIFGRITAVADVFDALGSDRVYKKAWDLERILNLFKEERGEHFQAKLVDLFLDNIDKFLEVRAQYQDEYIEVEKKYDNDITILGAYGTKGRTHQGTTSFSINKQHVIDAGNLLHGLEEKAAHVEGIWLTHEHLDHIADLASILDSYFAQRVKPLKIYGLQSTLDSVRECFLNDRIWPDFSKIKLLHDNKMSVEYHPIKLNRKYILDEETSIEAFKTDHTDGSCGYVVKKNKTAVLITADTVNLKGALDIYKSRRDITAMVLECSFPNNMEKLSVTSKHMTANMLFSELKVLDANSINLYVNHIKPLFLDEVSNEIDEAKGDWEVTILKDMDKIEF